MRIRVVFLGGLPHGLETHGGRIELEVRDGSSVGDIRQRLGVDSGWPAAVGRQAVLDAETLIDGTEVAFIGPMEGGALQ